MLVRLVHVCDHNAGELSPPRPAWPTVSAVDRPAYALERNPNPNLTVT